MTWRERIQAARERGAFSAEDIVLWADPATCFVGEQRERYSLHFPLDMGLPETVAKLYESLPAEPVRLQTRILHAIRTNDFYEAERLLDLVEDRALELKREQPS